MKLGIMQPYFFPYISYWQLINAVDEYIIYDDVNFIKGGWINRNQILLEDHVKYIHLPMIGSSSNKKICEISVNNQSEVIQKQLRLIDAAYHKAPYFKEIFPMIQSAYLCGEQSIAALNGKIIEDLCQYLNINTKLYYSSHIEKNHTLKGQDKVIHLCKKFGADIYVNASGGKSLYSPKEFFDNGIKLQFLSTNPIQYKQWNQTFYDNLSIIDVLMFNSRKSVINMLAEYQLESL